MLVIRGLIFGGEYIQGGLYSEFYSIYTFMRVKGKVVQILSIYSPCTMQIVSWQILGI